LNDKEASKLDYNKLYQASRDQRGLSQPINLPSDIKTHPDFNKHHRKFYGIDKADTASEWNRNVGKFFDANQPKV
jgi:hypothetical protein